MSHEKSGHGTNGIWAGVLLLAAAVAFYGIWTYSAGPTGATRTEGKPLAASASRSLEHLNAGNFDENVLRSNAPVLVDFYADWCGPCQMLAPVLEEVAVEMPNARIVKVNVDENPELAKRYQISAIPQMLVFRDGKVAARHAGLAGKERVKELLVE